MLLNAKQLVFFTLMHNEGSYGEKKTYKLRGKQRLFIFSVGL